jgi:hypothetical protein
MRGLASDIVRERGDEGIARVHELTGGHGVESVLECVGHDLSMQTAIGIIRPGGSGGRVGMPQHEQIPTTRQTFFENWTSDELHKIGSAEELELAAVREDGTLRPALIMRVVRDGDDVYVRSVDGRGSSWFRGTEHRHEARIRAGGVERDVALVETDAANDEVDAAYHARYDRPYPSIVPRIVATHARRRRSSHPAGRTR